jgi:hypothetical protein
VIASHYAEPVPRIVSKKSPLRAAPDENSERVRDLASGEPFDMLDDSLGWAWGYAGADRRVGYVRSEVLVAR